MTRASGRIVPARPERWATPIVVPGAGNAHRITPTVYRSAQPTHDGMRAFERLGVRRVLNLRRFSSDVELVQGTSLALDEMRINTWKVRDHHVISVLRILQQPHLGPFLIHCWHGADRTGLMSAMFRIVVQDWTREDALEELVHGGYGFHGAWRNIIAYVEDVDVAGLRAAVDGPSRPAGPLARRRSRGLTRRGLGRR